MRVGRYALVAAVAAVFASQKAGAETIRLEAENYKAGGSGVGHFDNDAGNNGGAYRADNVDIEGAEGGFGVGWTGGGEWLKLTVDPGTWLTDPTFAGGRYYMSTRAAGYGGGPLRVEVDGKMQRVSPAYTDGWQNWATTSANASYGMDISPGQHEVKINFEDGNFNLNWVELSTVRPAFTPQRSVTPPVAMLPNVGGQWSIREVIGAGNMNNLGDVATALNSGAGTIVDYRAPMVNMQDSGGRGRFVRDKAFGVVQAGHVGAGNADNVLSMMTTYMVIPADGTYTFDVASDDGFEFSIDGNMVMQADYGKGDNDILGRANLTQGVHQVRVLYWEGGGGASVEVTAAAGDKDAFDYASFRPIGYKNSKDHWSIPGLAGKATMEATVPGPADSVTNLTQAQAALIAGRTGGTNLIALVDSVNHTDPDNGNLNSGQFPGDQAFPNHVVGRDEDNFAVLVTGSLAIPESGWYQLGFNSDDGGALRIPGITWASIVENGTGAAIISGDALIADAPTGWSFTAGEAYLAAGTYPFEALMFEWGGGSMFELFGRGVSDGGLADPNWHLLANGGDRTAPDFNGVQIVPEPGSLGLLGIGCLAMLARRRRS